MTKKKIIIFAILLLSAGFFDYHFTLPFLYEYFKPTKCSTYIEHDITIKNSRIIAEVANDDCKRILGLSGRKTLEPGKAMIFEYENDGIREIWMKNMNFPIDIIWINSSFEIVGIENNVDSSTYPQKFGGEYRAKYVIELPVNFINNNNISRGDTVLLNI